MARTTSFTLGEHFEKFITRELDSGRYATASEVVRAALRLLEEREAHIEAVRSALIESEGSGFVEGVSVETIVERANRNRSTGTR